MLLSKTSRCVFWFVSLFLVSATSLCAIEIDTLFSDPNLSEDLLAQEIVEDATYFQYVGSSATTIRISDLNPEPSNPRAIGCYDLAEVDEFLIPVSQKPLPSENQIPGSTFFFEDGLAGATPDVSYRLSVQRGVCLCTGFARTADYADNLNVGDPAIGLGFGKGAEGPNNGQRAGSQAQGNDSIRNGNTSGFEPGHEFSGGFDDDFENEVINSPGGSGDAAVLEFRVRIRTPGYLRVSLIFASDEVPNFVDLNFNDSIGIFVKAVDDPAPGPGQNIFTFRDEATGLQKQLTLFDLFECPELFEANRPAPAADGDTTAFAPLTNDMEQEPNFEPDFFFDHEYNGFTPLLSRQTGDDPDTPSLEYARLMGPLKPSDPPVEYTIKIVIQDVRDRGVDSAIFIPEDGIQFIAILPADFNMDGQVDSTDFNTIGANWQMTNAEYRDGDATGDGIVDAADMNIYGLWSAPGLWDTGDAHPLTDDGLSADFNGDGIVDMDDLDVFMWFNGVDSPCVSRFEGDANGDGRVDSEDGDIILTELGF